MRIKQILMKNDDVLTRVIVVLVLVDSPFSLSMNCVDFTFLLKYVWAGGYSQMLLFLYTCPIQLGQRVLFSGPVDFRQRMASVCWILNNRNDNRRITPCICSA